MLSVIWAGDKPLTQAFGRTTLTVEPLWNHEHIHCGVDIGVVVGTPLKAARTGRVGAVGPGYLGIEVGTEVDWYIHIDRAVVSLGQLVAQGQLVAYSGNKSAGGTTTGAHLHFEVQRCHTALHGRGGSASVNNAGVAGNLNYPGTAVNPADALAGRYPGISNVHLEEPMLYVGPFHAKPVTLTVFSPGSTYVDPAANAAIVSPLAKGATVELDGYRYTSSPIASTDLSGAAGTQTGNDACWWHRKDGKGWVPDAILNTSKLVPVPTPTVPAAEVGTFVNYFAVAGAQPDNLDLDALVAAVLAKLPPSITVDQVTAAIRDSINKSRISIP